MKIINMSKEILTVILVKLPKRFRKPAAILEARCFRAFADGESSGIFAIAMEDYQDNKDI